MNTLFDQARDSRDDGMARATNRAERVDPGWTDRALEFLTRFAADGSEFIAEDVVKAAARAGIVGPDGRAWGGVFQTASRRGLIRKTGGYRAAATSNLSPKPIWRRA